MKTRGASSQTKTHGGQTRGAAPQQRTSPVVSTSAPLPCAAHDFLVLNHGLGPVANRVAALRKQAT
jgi:hypothetical protein